MKTHIMPNKAFILTSTLIAAIILGIYCYVSGFFSSRLEAPKGVPYVKQVPDNWPLYQQQRQQAKAKHLRDYAEANDHFTNFSVSQTDGIPLIILKLLPQLAPEYWGESDNFLSVMGLFYDDSYPGFPFPKGIGFSGLSRPEANGNIDYASFTCGGCHVGRVRLPSGKLEYLEGGINSQFDVIGFRRRVVQTLNKVYGGEKDQTRRYEKVTQAVLSALEKVTSQNPNYFYNDYVQLGYRYGPGDKSLTDRPIVRKFDAKYESEQIKLFKENSSQYVKNFVDHHETVYSNWLKVAKDNYPAIEERIAVGFPGMEDAIGFNAVAASSNLKASTWTAPFSKLPFPKVPGITDIMVIWEQNLRNPDWNHDKSRLINGGGQWNGHIPLPIYKNLAAQITLGYSNVDPSVSAFADDLISELPATVYPFEVDVKLAKKGQQLFKDNCAACHQPNNGKVYQNVGTNSGRALIAGTVITLGAQYGFTAEDACSTSTIVNMYGKNEKPCATYKGVSLEGKSKEAMTPPKVHNGYNAQPLTGLWAQAPYLHTGAVPTLYHLLIPSERPDRFIKSRLDYDTHMVGFSWQIDPAETSPRNEGYLFEPIRSPSISNKGHDQNIEMDGHVYKLNWEDDKEGAMALIEYLKTL